MIALDTGVYIVILIWGLVINFHGIFPITDNSGTIYDLLALQPGYAAGTFFCCEPHSKMLVFQTI